jgi:hypothetical protein
MLWRCVPARCGCAGGHRALLLPARARVRLLLPTALRSHGGVILKRMPAASVACYAAPGWTVASYRGCALRPCGSLAARARKPHATRVRVGLHASGAVLLDGSLHAACRRAYVTPYPRAAVLIARHERPCVARRRRRCAERAAPHGVRSPPRELRLGEHTLLNVRRPAVHTARGVAVRGRRATGLTARQRPCATHARTRAGRVVWRQARTTRRRRDKLCREGASVASGAAPRAVRRRAARAPRPRRV